MSGDNTDNSRMRRNLMPSFDWTSSAYRDANSPKQSLLSAEFNAKTDKPINKGFILMDPPPLQVNDAPPQRRGFMTINPLTLPKPEKKPCVENQSQGMAFYVSLSPPMTRKVNHKPRNRFVSSANKFNYENDENEVPIHSTFELKMFNDSLEEPNFAPNHDDNDDDDDDRRKTFIVNHLFKSVPSANRTIPSKPTIISKKDDSPLASSVSSVSSVETVIMKTDFEFIVPERLPAKIRKKLSLSKVTPMKRPMPKVSSSIKQSVTPSPFARNTQIKYATAIKKKRNSKGNASSASLNALNRSLQSELNPYASRNMYYDEHWMDEEESAVMSWINFILSPKFNVEHMDIDTKVLINECLRNAPQINQTPLTKDDVSNQTYAEVKKLNQLRQIACQLYQKPEMVNVMNKVDYYIETNRIEIRKDRAIHADVGIKKHILELVLSYNPLWLRIGLETVYGQLINLSSNRDARGLTRFIVQNFLTYKELAAKHGHRNVPNFFRDAHHEMEAKRYIFKKFLLLLNFLDYAKKMRIIEHDPCLFRINAPYKSTRDMIISFARDYVTGVGDIIKYLKHSGFSLEYQQTQLEEFAFTVKNIAVDLRCGIRLTRLAELLLKRNDLCCQLHYPASNRTRKLHNVQVAMNAFSDVIPENLTNKDIVDGNRDKTLDMIWSIIFKKRFLFVFKITDEHKHVPRYLARQRFMIIKNAAVCIQRNWRKYLHLKKNSKQIQAAIKIQRFVRRLLWEKRTKKMEIAAVVIQRIYRKHLIKRRAAIVIQSAFREWVMQKRMAKLQCATIVIQRRFRANALMKRERNNYCLMKSRVTVLQSHIRGWLLRKRIEKMRNATIVIQRNWRVYLNKKMNEKRIDAATKIQRFIRQWLYDRRMKRMESAAVVIQRNYRKYIKRKAAIVIQSAFRGYMMRKRLDKLRCATIVIQRRFRANALMKRERNNYCLIKSRVIILQSHIRGWLLRKQMEKMRNATIVIQRSFRRWLLKKRMEKMVSAAVVIQRNYRKYLLKRNAAIAIQSAFRGYMMRMRIKKLRCATIVIQRRFRANVLMKIERDTYCLIKSRVIILQSLVRGYLMRKRMEKMRNASVVIQRNWRKFLDNKQKKKRINAVIKIQRFVRQWLWEKRLKKMESAAVVIQRNYRKYIKRKAAIVIQSAFRGWMMRIRFEQLRCATIVIQRRFRANALMKRERNNYCFMKNRITILQSFIRGWLLRKRIVKMLNATIVIQRYWRMCLCKLEKRRIIKAATIVQSFWKGYKTRKIIFEQNQKVKDAHQRIVMTSLEVDCDMQLGRRTSSALERLLTYKYLLPLTCDLKSLDTTTKLSPESCRTIANSDAINVLIQIIRESNRSEPHKTIIQHTLSILLNLSKYEQTISVVMENSEIIDEIFKLIKIYNRNDDIINICYSLLWTVFQGKQILEGVIEDKRKIVTLKQIYEMSINEMSARRMPKMKKLHINEIKFTPQWSTARNVQYQFEDRFIAIKAIAIRTKIVNQ